jgi:hypothetical protein
MVSHLKGDHKLHQEWRLLVNHVGRALIILMMEAVSTSNVGYLLRDYTAQRPTRQPYAYFWMGCRTFLDVAEEHSFPYRK